MFLISFLNFLSHFFVPKLLKYSAIIKLVNSLNLVVVGVMVLVVLLYYKFNSSANFCSGYLLSQKEREAQLALSRGREFLIHRGDVLWVYSTLVLTMTGLFLSTGLLFCIINLKKLGF